MYLKRTGAARTLLELPDPEDSGYEIERGFDRPAILSCKNKCKYV